MRLLRFIANLKFLPEPKRLELYPPFFVMRVKVLEMRDNWRFMRLRLPLNTLSRNPGGGMFGGWQAALADPIAAIACVRVFPGY
jgi:acyl-coenzyme A thioesterase PaaI-like protein